VETNQPGSQPPAGLSAGEILLAGNRPAQIRARRSVPLCGTPRDRPAARPRDRRHHGRAGIIGAPAGEQIRRPPSLLPAANDVLPAAGRFHRPRANGHLDAPLRAVAGSHCALH